MKIIKNILDVYKNPESTVIYINSVDEVDEE